MLFNQHPDLPHLSGGWIILAVILLVLTNTDLNTFVNNIWEKYIYCVRRKRFFIQRKQKCCVYILVQCILLYSLLLPRDWCHSHICDTRARGRLSCVDPCNRNIPGLILARDLFRHPSHSVLMFPVSPKSPQKTSALVLRQDRQYYVNMGCSWCSSKQPALFCFCEGFRFKKPLSICHSFLFLLIVFMLCSQLLDFKNPSLCEKLCLSTSSSGGSEHVLPYHPLKWSNFVTHSCQ